MEINIRVIVEADYQEVYSFQCEYLDREDYESFIRRAKAHPDFYIGAFLLGELVGICYGEPFLRDINTVCLQGIAVDLDQKKGLARRGIGSMLIKYFEELVKEKGYYKISLGSAEDDKVERFYLKNGFIPNELVAKGPFHKEYERLFVNDYNSGLILRKKLYDKYHPEEVIFIFEKSI